MEPNTVVKEWTEFPDLEVLEFDAGARRYREIVDLEKALKSEKDALSKDLEAALTVTGEKSVRVNDLVVIQANGRAQSFISAPMLAQHGVDADTIADCTIPGKRYTYVQVKRKEEKESA